MEADTGGSLGLRIIGSHLVEGDAKVGAFTVISPDLIMAHDVTAPPALDMINGAGLPYLRGADRTVLYLDHFTPPKDLAAAEACRSIREFGSRYRLKEIVEWGEGICHVHLFEDGRLKRGDLVVAADSHITTGGALGILGLAIGSTDLASVMATNELWLEVPEPFGIVFKGTPDVWCEGKDLALRMLSWMGPGGGKGKLLELDGPILKWMHDDSRMTVTNMASEASCVSAIMTNDVKEYGPLSPDWVWDTEEVDIDEMGPQVALPGSPDDVEEVDNLSGVLVDQVFIGSCTNGRLEDLRVAASVLAGRKVHPDVRLLVIPGSRAIYSQAYKAGYIKTILDAGGVVSMPTCGPCSGGFLGVLPEAEVALSTSNRNFKGRMGDPFSRVYLSGAAVAAASAVKGMIVHPQEVTS